jgi:hypothetical protein
VASRPRLRSRPGFRWGVCLVRHLARRRQSSLPGVQVAERADDLPHGNWADGPGPRQWKAYLGRRDGHRSHPPEGGSRRAMRSRERLRVPGSDRHRDRRRARILLRALRAA